MLRVGVVAAREVLGELVGGAEADEPPDCTFAAPASPPIAFFFGSADGAAPPPLPAAAALPIAIASLSEAIHFSSSSALEHARSVHVVTTVCSVVPSIGFASIVPPCDVTQKQWRCDDDALPRSRFGMKTSEPLRPITPFGFFEFGPS